MKVAVVGSGIAGVSFSEELRKLDPSAEISLLTQETAGYYSRPLLSHGFTRDDIETRIILRSFADLAAAGIAVCSGVEVLSLDLGQHCLTYADANGQRTTIGYERLVLAPGSAALIPPPFLASAGLFRVLNSYRDLVALRQLRSAVREAGGQPRWAVIGGGLIGCEVASDLAMAGDEITLFHALPRLMERQLVPEDSERLLAVLRQQWQVTVRLNAAVSGFSGVPGALAVHADETIEAGFHGILVACGFKPRTAVAQAAGLATRRGILVNEWLTTASPDVHVIGDAAELPDGKLFAYVTPVRSQALWLAKHLTGQTSAPWEVPAFKPKAKVHGFTATHPYLF